MPFLLMPFLSVLDVKLSSPDREEKRVMKGQGPLRSSCQHYPEIFSGGIEMPPPRTTLGQKSVHAHKKGNLFYQLQSCESNSGVPTYYYDLHGSSCSNARVNA